MSDELEPLGAYLDPYVAAVFVRCSGQLLRELEVYGQKMVLAGSKRRGREVLDSLTRLRNSARQYKAAYDANRGTSGAGRSEVPTGVSATSSDSFSLVTTREAAEQLGVSDRQVRYFCRDGRLSGVLRGGRWWIDELSLAEELKRREERSNG